MIPGETVEQVTTELRSKIESELARSTEITHELEFLDWNEPVQTPLDSPFPAVNVGAGDYRVCHEPNEYVTVDELLASARVVMGTVIDICRSLMTRGRLKLPGGRDESDLLRSGQTD